jgi:hypothetical protein
MNFRSLLVELSDGMNYSCKNSHDINIVFLNYENTRTNMCLFAMFKFQALRHVLINKASFEAFNWKGRETETNTEKFVCFRP